MTNIHTSKAVISEYKWNISIARPGNVALKHNQNTQSTQQIHNVVKQYVDI